MKHPRYIVCESRGYPITDSGATAGNQREQIEVMVLDRGYCHRVVWSSLTTVNQVVTRRLGWDRRYAVHRRRTYTERREATAFRWPLTKRRAYAADLAARLNCEHDAWLAA